MYTFIFDIGKTNIKAHVIDANGSLAWSRVCANEVSEDGVYPHFDVAGIWQWLRDTLREAAQHFEIHAINVSTHGACALLLDESGNLVLPALDYEHPAIATDDIGYEAVRPAYEDTRSPELGAGLNLGRQLWWLKNHFPGPFGSAHWVMLYPQYWVYRLTGVAVSEVTSLGCHTDLWEPERRRYSRLVVTLGIGAKLPPLIGATSSVGSVLPTLAGELGLPAECRVYAGVHDSNASFARYLAAGLSGSFTVISTGTWVVAMCSEGKLERLREERDMLANVSVLGDPLACARFMGGREYQRLCELTGASVDDPVTAEALQRVVDDAVYACPPFVAGSGPFQGKPAAGDALSTGSITGPVQSGAALATLYLVLMVDYQLDLLDARGPILFGGGAHKNPLLCHLLAQLRPQQPVMVADDSASSIRGAWCLTQWGHAMPDGITALATVTPANIDNLFEYRRGWRDRVFP